MEIETKKLIVKCLCNAVTETETIPELEKPEEIFCEKCGDTGVIEIIGDGDNFEVDVIGVKRCPCQDYE